MTTALLERLAKLDELTLETGAHDSFDEGVCAVELISWLADEPFSDHPECVSPVLGQFLRSWNDALDDAGRQKLKPFLPRAISTSKDGRDEERAWLCTDWLVRVCAPAWLELAGVKESPAALRALSPILSTEAAKIAQPSIEEARKRGAAARDAARAAARAAGAAARDAARAAAWAAAWAAEAAAGDAARDAAWAAAWAAARAAAGAAASKKLEPTKIELQASALELLEQMVKPIEEKQAA
jgi:hypothetical protein